MGKRKGRKVFPSSYNASRVHVLRIPNPDVIAAYSNAVKTTQGPKNNMEPVLDHSFTRPMVDGKIGHYKCSKCGIKYYTTVSWEQHLRKFRASEWADHEAEFVQDLQRSHVIPEVYVGGTGDDRVIGLVTIHHNKLPTPKNEVWQSIRRQGVTEWRWIKISSTRKATVRLGFNGAKWKFSQELSTGEITHYSHEFSSKEQAMMQFNSSRILWVPI